MIHLYIVILFLLVPVRELDVPGDIYERKTYPFEFPTVEMPYDTYNGVNVRLRYVICFNFPLFLDFTSFCYFLCFFRYVLKVTVTRGYAGSIVEYQEFMVLFLPFLWLRVIVSETTKFV